MDNESARSFQSTSFDKRFNGAIFSCPIKLYASLALDGMNLASTEIRLSVNPHVSF